MSPLTFVALAFTLTQPVAVSPEAGVSGTVLEAGSNTPVPGAQVTLMSLALRPQPGRPPERLVATTDQNGRYHFDALEPGRYRGSVGTNAEWSDARLRAFAFANDVYVDFAIAVPIVDWLDVGFLEHNQILVKWEIDLRPAAARETYSVRFIDRTVRRSTLEVFVSPSTAPGTCETSRQLNGRWLEPRRFVSCADAYRAMSSFDVPVFTLTGVTPGSFDVTIRATVTGGRSVKVKTPVLARTKLIQPINSER